MAEMTMRELVERLAPDNSEALLELLEFDYALEALLRDLALLAVASRGLHSATQNLVPTGDEQVHAVQEQAGRLSARTTYLLGAFRELRAGVLNWHIVDARRHSSRPSPGGSSAPPAAGE